MTVFGSSSYWTDIGGIEQVRKPQSFDRILCEIIIYCFTVSLSLWSHLVSGGTVFNCSLFVLLNRFGQDQNHEVLIKNYIPFYLKVVFSAEVYGNLSRLKKVQLQYNTS